MSSGNGATHQSDALLFYFRLGITLGLVVGAGTVWWWMRGDAARAKAAKLRAEARVIEGQVALYEAAAARFDPADPSVPQA